MKGKVFFQAWVTPGQAKQIQLFLTGYDKGVREILTAAGYVPGRAPPGARIEPLCSERPLKTLEIPKIHGARKKRSGYRLSEETKRLIGLANTNKAQAMRRLIGIDEWRRITPGAKVQPALLPAPDDRSA